MAYGTVAKMTLKPGMEEAFLAQNQRWNTERKPTVKGAQGSYVLRSDSNPNEIWLVVTFDSKEDYQANAKSPGQDAEFQKLRALLESDPEWHDGEWIVGS